MSKKWIIILLLGSLLLPFCFPDEAIPVDWGAQEQIQRLQVPSVLLLQTRDFEVYSLMHDKVPWTLIVVKGRQAREFLKQMQKTIVEYKTEHIIICLEPNEQI